MEPETTDVMAHDPVVLTVRLGRAASPDGEPLFHIISPPNGDEEERDHEHEAPDDDETVAAAIPVIAERLRLVLERDHGAVSRESERLVATIAQRAHRSRAAQTAALEAGTLSLLVAMRGPPTAASRYSDSTQRVEMAATRLLVRGHALTPVGAGFVVASLVRALASALGSVVTLALEALRELVAVDGNGAARHALLDAGGVARVSRIARDGGAASDRALATSVLWTLARDPRVAALAHQDVQALADALPALELAAHEAPPAVSTALAEAVLTRVMQHPDDEDSDNEDRVHALLREVRNAETDATAALPALEDLSALLWSRTALYAPATAADELVPLCLAWLLSSSRSAAGEAARSVAGFALMGVLVHDASLHGAVRDAVSVDALVEQLATGNTAAVYVLGPLVDGDADLQREAAAKGAVAALVAVLRDARDPQQQFVAARALSRLVQLDEMARAEALHSGAMAALARFLARTGPGHGTILALASIERLARDNAAARDSFLAAGGAATVVQALVASEPGGMGRVAASDTLLTLAAHDAAAQNAFVDAGAVAPLVACLSSSASSGGAGAEVAARALRCLLECGAAAQDAVSETGGISALVRLVETEDDDSAAMREAAAAALGAAVHDHAVNQTAAARAHTIGALAEMLYRHSDGHNVLTARRALACVSGRVEPLDAAALATVEADVVQLAVDRLRSVLTEQTCERETRAIELLVAGNAAARAAALEAGALGALLHVQSHVELTLSAASAVAFLVDGDDAAKTRALDDHDAVRVLVSALRVAGFVQLERALVRTLQCLVANHERAQRALAAADGGLIRIRELLALDADADDATHARVEETVALVFELSKCQDGAMMDAIVWDTGILVALLAALPHLRDEVAQRNALFTVAQAPAFDTARRDSLCALCPLELVLRLMTTSGASAALQVAALAVVFAVCEEDNALRAAAVDGGALEVAVALVRTPSEYGVGYLCTCVAELIAEDAHAERVAVEQLGVVALLGGLLATDIDGDERTGVAVALASIRSAQREALAAGVLAPLLEHMRIVDFDIEQSLAGAARALAILVDGNAEAQRACVAAGALPLVLELAERPVSSVCGSVARRRHAARALASFVGIAVEAEAERVDVLARVDALREQPLDEETRAFVEAAHTQLLSTDEERTRQADAGSGHGTGIKAAPRAKTCADAEDAAVARGGSGVGACA